MVFDASLFNIQHYNALIKGKLNNSEKGVVFYLYSNYWKGNLRVTINYGRQTYLLTIYIYIYIYRERERVVGEKDAKWNMRSILGQYFISLNLEFTFSKTDWNTKVKEDSLPNFLPITGRRIIRYIALPRVLGRYELQPTWSRIRTWVTMHISNDNNHYSASVSSVYVRVCVYVSVCVSVSMWVWTRALFLPLRIYEYSLISMEWYQK